MREAEEHPLIGVVQEQLQFAEQYGRLVQLLLGVHMQLTVHAGVEQKIDDVQLSIGEEVAPERI